MLITQYPCLKVNMFVKNGQFITGGLVLSWNGNRINAVCASHDGKEVIGFGYTDGDGNTYTYAVDVIKRPSNLGTGFVRYFKCPYTGKPCRKMYMGRGIIKWASRGYFNSIGRRLYYPSQMLSGRPYLNYRMQKIEDTIDELQSRKLTYEYAGQETRVSKRIRRLQDRYNECDEQWVEYFYNNAFRILKG